MIVKLQEKQLSQLKGRNDQNLVMQERSFDFLRSEIKQKKSSSRRERESKFPKQKTIIYF